jgi:hypothetical protein
MLAAYLGPSEKRALELLADWPWLRIDHLAVLLGVGRVRLLELSQRAIEWELIVRVNISGRIRLALSDRGFAILARRDRASVGDLRKRWSTEPTVAAGGLDWRNVRGTRSRQLLRHLDHTESVHRFLAALAEQVREQGWDLIQLDPPQRASRYFHLHGKLYSIRPDAFGVLRCDGRDQPFFLEWERRAIRPSTMTRRLAPYLRYYSSRRPVEDQNEPPLVCVVFDNDLASDHFRRVAQEEKDRAGIELSLLVSDRRRLKQHCPLGPVWNGIDDRRPRALFAKRS